MITVAKFAAFNKNETHPRCPHCGTSLAIRYGTYPRAHPERGDPIRVPRFLCKSPECRRVTFSLLPPPLLPIVRHFYHTLLYCYALVIGDQSTQAEIAEQLKVTRGVAKRLHAFTQRFIPWWQQERKIAAWGDDPCSSWPQFSRDFSQKFYPWRCWGIAPTQYIPV